MFNYENENDGKRLIPDGGAAVSGGGGQPVGPTKVTPHNQLKESASGDAYGQFAAQAALSRAQLDGNKTAEQYYATQTKQFRANAFFGDEEWKTLDSRLLEVADTELQLVDQLRARGLTVTTDLSTLIYEYHRAVDPDPDDAEVSMGLETRGQDEVPGLGELDGIPIPITHKSYHLNRRTLNVDSRGPNQGTVGGGSINTRALDAAAKGVTNTIESMVYNGWDANVDGYDLPGLLTEPERNTFGGTNWGDAGTTNDDVRGDVLTAVETLENDNYGPDNTGYVLYHGRNVTQQLRRKRIGTDNRNSMLNELQNEFPYITFQRTSNLPAGQVVMMKPVPDVMELVVASDLTNVEYNSHAGFTVHMKVFGSIVPLVKHDSKNQSGIVHWTVDGSADPGA